MNPANNFKCLKCKSEYFVTEPIRYDVLKFYNERFEFVKSEFTNAKYKIFCRECGTEIDKEASLTNKKIILRNI